MNKKNYLVIGITILIFAILIIVIFLTKGNRQNWYDEILKADSYEMTMSNCNDRKITLPNSSLDDLISKWNNISNNGPWTGNNNICYDTITISFEKNGAIQNAEILLIDDNSIVLNLSNSSTYYTNSKEINEYFKILFNDTK